MPRPVDGCWPTKPVTGVRISHGAPGFYKEKRMSWSFNFKEKSRVLAALKVVHFRDEQNVPAYVIEAVNNAIAALPNNDDKVVQVICHGHVDENGGNVNVMVSLVSL